VGSHEFKLQYHQKKKKKKERRKEKKSRATLNTHNPGIVTNDWYYPSYVRGL
jgi:hypothetical protein